MLLRKCKGGARVALGKSELSRIDEMILAHGGQPRESITRPLGPDGSVTHRLYDFDEGGFAFSIDLRDCSRDGFRFHELDTSAALVGSHAVEELSFMLLSQLGLAAQFKHFSAIVLIPDSTIAAELPAGGQPIVVSTVEEIARAFTAHLPRG